MPSAADDLRLIRAGITLWRRRGGDDAGWHLKLPLGADTRREMFKRLRIWEHGSVHQIRARRACLPPRTPAAHHQLGHDVPFQESPLCEHPKQRRP
jgi:hypothetical protein